MSLPEPLSAEGSHALQAIIASPSETLSAMDFDGTLAPIVDDPERAYADPDALAALGRLGELVGAVAVITGRPARTVVRLGRFREAPGLSSMIVLGQYGMERWNAADDQFLIPPDPPQIGSVEMELPGLLSSFGLADARIEDKGRAVAVHTRSPLGELAARHGLVVEQGRNVWEIRAPGIDKGTALRSIVDETGARLAVFAGDDLGDLPAFQAVRDLASAGVTGLLVCSASNEEGALAELSDVTVDGPAGLAALLNEFADRLEGRA
jgi:trehalose 6-phosphate phosphatase